LVPLNGDLVRARRVFKSGKYSYEMNPEDLVNEYYNDNVFRLKRIVWGH